MFGEQHTARWRGVEQSGLYFSGSREARLGKDSGRMDGDEDLQRGHLGNGKACIDVFSINKEHEMPSDRSGDGTKSAYEPLSIDCEDNDLALYYGLALSLAQGEHWRHNISQPEGKLLHEATCSMQRFKSFWYNPAEFMLKCDLDKGTKVRGEGTV